MKFSLVMGGGSHSHVLCLVKPHSRAILQARLSVLLAQPACRLHRTVAHRAPELAQVTLRARDSADESETATILFAIRDLLKSGKDLNVLVRRNPLYHTGFQSMSTRVHSLRIWTTESFHTTHQDDCKSKVTGKRIPYHEFPCDIEQLLSLNPRDK
jgi:hypothetical protein